MSRAAVSLFRAVAPADLDPRFPLTRPELAALMDTLFATLGLAGSRVSLTLVDDAGIAALNARHLGRTGPTNILSFPEADPEHPGELGELYLSVETLAREAFLYGQQPCSHLARLLAHGLLHLAGHDHGPEMEEMTDLAVSVAESVHGEGGCGGSCQTDW